MDTSKKHLITKNTVIIENGKVKSVLTEEAAHKGYVPIEEAKRLSKLYLEKLLELDGLK